MLKLKSDQAVRPGHQCRRDIGRLERDLLFWREEVGLVTRLERLIGLPRGLLNWRAICASRIVYNLASDCRTLRFDSRSAHVWHRDPSRSGILARRGGGACRGRVLDVSMRPDPRLAAVFNVPRYRWMEKIERDDVVSSDGETIVYNLSTRQTA